MAVFHPLVDIWYNRIELSVKLDQLLWGEGVIGWFAGDVGQVSRN